MIRPLLLLDVDGPLNPWAAPPHRRPKGYETHRMRPAGWEGPRVKDLPVWLNPDHGRLLLALPFELVWATTWVGEANQWIAPNLSLPEQPYIDWPKSVPRRRRLCPFDGEVSRVLRVTWYDWLEWQRILAASCGRFMESLRGAG